MRLEDFRKDNIGQIYAWLPKKGNDESSMLLITYPYYTIRAFYFSCQNLEQLEQSKGAINQGNVSISAVGFWFLAVEAFINTLIKIICLHEGKNFKRFRGKDIGSRLSLVFDLLMIDKQDFYRSGILPKLEEFKSFRNEVFHDRFFDSEVQFRKTSFSPIPYLANQVDVIQASIIALEIFQAFRFVYPGLDLMPDVFVQKNSSFGFIKYDFLFQEVVEPLFLRSLQKHSITTDLTTDLVDLILPESSVIKEGEVHFVTRAIHKEGTLYSANDIETRIGADLFDKARNLINIDEEENFQIPNYKRAK